MPPLLEAWFGHLTLTRKLIALSMATTATALAVLCLVLGVFDFSSSRRGLVSDLTMLADVVGRNSTAALAFGDAKAAHDILDGLHRNEHIVTPALLPALPPDAMRPGFQWHAFGAHDLVVVRPVVLGTEVVGAVIIDSDLRGLSSRALAVAQTGVLALGAALWLALVVGSRLQRAISVLLLRLTEIAGTVAREHRYDVRPPGGRGGPADEINVLTAGFNRMLEELRERDASLLARQERLEAAVEARTAELRAMNVDMAAARDKAMDANLARPVEQATLVVEMQRVLQGTSVTKASPDAVPATPAPSNILLAEDNVVNQRVAIALLEKRGHRVTLAANGREAIDAVLRDRFDLVLMDVQMPGMGGLEATAAIRRHELQTGEHVRIVAMTAHAMVGDRERCLAAGMDGYLTKPIDQTELFEVIAQAGRNEAPVAAAALAEATFADTIHTFDVGGLLARVGGDAELMRTVVKLFLQDYPARLAAIRAAIDRGDAEGLRTTAHALRGAAGTLSARGVVEASQTLERMGAERQLSHAAAAWDALHAKAALLASTLRAIAVEGTCAP